MRRDRCDGFTAAAVADASGRTIERNDRSCVVCVSTAMWREYLTVQMTYQEERGREEGVDEDEKVEAIAETEQCSHKSYNDTNTNIIQGLSEGYAKSTPRTQQTCILHRREDPRIDLKGRPGKGISKQKWR